MSSRPIIISLEGNIGAGKSTFLEHLEKNLGKNSGWLYLREPVHIWETIQDKNGKTVLANFYEDPKKYAFPFQVMAYTTRLHELKRIVKENPDCKGIICERSLEADKHIFAKMLHQDGLMDDIMYTIYEKYFSEYEDMFSLDGIIYLDANPETCFQRIQMRSRDGESNIELEYLQKCNDFHNEWFLNTNTHVMSLDVNDNVNVDKQDIRMLGWVNKAARFVNTFTLPNNQSAIIRS